MIKGILIIMSGLVLVVLIESLTAMYNNYLETSLKLKCIEAKGDYTLLPGNSMIAVCKFNN